METYHFEGQTIIRELSAGGRVWRSGVKSLTDEDAPAASAWWQSFLRGAGVFLESAGPDLPPIRSVDAFCGCGGLTLGAAQAAIAIGRRLESVAAIDVDEGALEVHKFNFGTRHTIAGNASSVVDFHVSGSGEQSRFAYEPEIIEPRLLAEVGKVDLFLAGPPCQGHSNLNNRTRREDPRNLLYLTAVALGVGLKARLIAIENVPEVVNDKSGVVKAAKALLRAAQYKFIDDGVLSAHELGGAQTRKRYFLIAAREEIGAEELTIEGVKTGMKRAAHSLRWAIADLMRGPKDEPKAGIMDASPVMSEVNRNRINHLFDNKLWELPNEVRPDCHKDGHTYPSVYGRLHWDKPSQTITTGFSTPGRGRYIHPDRRRVITAHEAARIQSFPDTFQFVVNGHDPSRLALTKWIGDAVPPLLGYAATLPLLTRL